MLAHHTREQGSSPALLACPHPGCLCLEAEWPPVRPSMSSGVGFGLPADNKLQRCSVTHIKWRGICTSPLHITSLHPSVHCSLKIIHNTLLFLFSPSVVSDSLQPHGLQQARPPCPSSFPGVCSNSCPLSQGRRPIVSSSVVPFTSCLLSFPASGSFLMSLLFASDGQSVGASASASVLPMNI